jgi:hypothetical protein
LASISTISSLENASKLPAFMIASHEKNTADLKKKVIELRRQKRTLQVSEEVMILARRIAALSGKKLFEWVSTDLRVLLEKMFREKISRESKQQAKAK